MALEMEGARLRLLVLALKMEGARLRLLVLALEMEGRGCVFWCSR